MKMENIHVHDLLKAYMKQQYAGKEALVIFQDDAGSCEESETLMRELDEMGLRPPKSYRPFGMLIIEMPAGLAKKLINQHDKGSFRMELFSDGECVHENR